MIIAEALGITAGIFSLLGFIPYLYSTVHGKTHPNKATWIIWTIVGGLLAVSFFSEGDGSASWLPFSYFIGPLAVALFSIKYGYSEWTRLDIVCLVAAVLSIIPWVLSDNASTTLVINVFIDILGAIPTILKAYRKPETEDFTAWMLFWIGNTLELFAIVTWNVAALYPIYLFVLASTMIALTFRNTLQKYNK